METIEKKENLSTENSLRIITETMERSRMAIAKNSGKTILMWGVLVAVTSIVVYFLWSKTGNPSWNLLWFAMGAIGGIGTAINSRNREKVPVNEISRVVGKTWMWYGIMTTAFYALIWVAAYIKSKCCGGGIINVNITLIIVMMMGIAGVVSGVVMKMKSIVACCVVATLLSVLVALLVNGPEQILVFTILGVVALVIPGLILQNKGKSLNK